MNHFSFSVSSKNYQLHFETEIPVANPVIGILWELFCITYCPSKWNLVFPIDSFTIYWYAFCVWSFSPVKFLGNREEIFIAIPKLSLSNLNLKDSKSNFHPLNWQIPFIELAHTMTLDTALNTVIAFLLSYLNCLINLNQSRSKPG